MQFKRSDRVGDLIRKEIAVMLLGDIRDPRVALVTITKVSVSDDLQQAKVYFTTLGDEDERGEALKGLQSASGFIRRTLAQRVSLRRIPSIRFTYDSSIEYGDHIEQLIERAREGS
ncbi:MAG: 30S ribosome-binding factor RbfA [Deltaproteobacteria bacterium]|nr:30S ribosome-binding factor RbfA [Deltaproteobacteria bacterium]